MVSYGHLLPCRQGINKVVRDNIEDRLLLVRSTYVLPVNEAYANLNCDNGNEIRTKGHPYSIDPNKIEIPDLTLLQTKHISNYGKVGYVSHKKVV